MTANMLDRYSPKKRSKIKNMPDSCFCVEINLGRPLPIYQFQLRNFTSNEATILVNKESSLIDHLKIGEKIKMRYWSVKNPWGGEFFEAEIKHVKKQGEDRKNGAIIVVFEILKNQLLNLDVIAQSFLDTKDDINTSTKRNIKNKKRDRQQMSDTVDLPERRSGKQRRKDFDRRSGSERRKSLERRSAKKLL